LNLVVGVGLLLAISLVLGLMFNATVAAVSPGRPGLGLAEHEADQGVK
jgi:hypothetical protein